MDVTQDFIDALKKSTVKNVAQGERFDLIYKNEMKSWSHEMGNKDRSEIPQELQPLLDEHIEKSQAIAREASQTEELTEAYFKRRAV